MITYRILPEVGLILVVPSGTTDEQEVIALSERLRADPQFSQSFDALVDNTHLEHPPTGEELRELAEPRTQVVRPDTRLAVIAPKDLTYGTSRMHQMLAESRNPLHIQVFRDRSSALRWLDVQDVRVETALDEMGRERKG